jgi:hypothetical protein
MCACAQRGGKRDVARTLSKKHAAPRDEGVDLVRAIANRANESAYSKFLTFRNVFATPSNFQNDGPFRRDCFACESSCNEGANPVQQPLASITHYGYDTIPSEEPEVEEMAWGSAQPFEKARFGEGKGLDFPSLGFDFPSPGFGFSSGSLDFPSSGFGAFSPDGRSSHSA